MCDQFHISLLFTLSFPQSRIEGEQTFSVIRNNSMNQVQVGEIVVGDIMMVSENFKNKTKSLKSYENIRC